VFRQERNFYKLDLRLPDNTQIELFSFPTPPKRLTYPEACGLGNTNKIHYPHFAI